MDTWCHFFVDGQMYNGTPVKGQPAGDFLVV